MVYKLVVSKNTGLFETVHPFLYANDYGVIVNEVRQIILGDNLGWYKVGWNAKIFRFRKRGVQVEVFDINGHKSCHGC